MFVVDNTVFIHLQKCAGTSIMNALTEQRFNDVKFCHIHKPTNFIPEEFKDYMKIVLVRNPLSWYNSFYNYLVFNESRKSPVDRIITNGGISSFGTYLNNALNFEEFMEPKSLWLKKKIILEKRPLLSELYPNVNDLNFQPTFYQQYYESMGVGECEIFHMEDQMAEVLEILKLKNIQKVNSTSQSSIPSKEHQELIINKDEFMFNLLGYRKEII